MIGLIKYEKINIIGTCGHFDECDVSCEKKILSGRGSSINVYQLKLNNGLFVMKEISKKHPSSVNPCFQLAIEFDFFSKLDLTIFYKHIRGSAKNLTLTYPTNTLSDCGVITFLS